MKSDKTSSRERLLDVAFEEVYIYGYGGASTTNILKKAKLPRGSMYYHFDNKKDLILVMIDERLIPKVRDFFDFKFKKSSSVVEVIEHMIKKMSKNEMLLTYGCPLHRLTYEMDTQDSDISKKCEEEFKHLLKDFKKLLKHGIKKGEIIDKDPKDLAEFFIASTWGILSRSASHSSKKRFLKDMNLLLDSITNKNN